MKKKNLRRFLISAAFVLTVSAAGVGSTLAYFTDQDAKANNFVTGSLEIGLEEPEWNPEKDGDGKNLYPGSVLYKNPTVKNVTDSKNGDQPCYVRMKVSVRKQDGSPVQDEAALKLIWGTVYYDKSFDGGYGKTGGKATGLVQGREPGYSLSQLAAYPMVNPLWQKDAKRSASGQLVFNYIGPDGSGILRTGEESVLFTNIVIPTDWTEKEISLAGGFQLEITSEAIQCESFSGWEEAWDAYENGGEGTAVKTAVQEGSV